MIITTTTIFLVQSIIVTWIMVTASTPCPQEYLDLGGDVIKYCEIAPSGLGREWFLKEQ